MYNKVKHINLIRSPGVDEFSSNLMKLLFFILLSLSISWYYTDLESSEVLYSKVAPFGVYYFLFSLVVWAVVKLKSGKTSSKATGWRSDVSDYFDFGFTSEDGGDGGGG